MEDPSKWDLLTLNMDVYKANIESYGSLDKLKLLIVIRRYFQNKEIIGDTWYPTVSIRTLKYLLSDSSKQKASLHQLGFIGEFLHSNVKHIVFFSWTEDMETNS